MSISRRALLTGASGATVLAVAACTADPPPQPEPSPDPSPGPARPTGIARSTWSSDQFSLGATSYVPVGVAAAHRGRLGEPVGDRLFFAGEATSTDAPNDLEGARATGVRAAGEIIRAASAGERIAVIGAGIAGCACAHRLRLAGFEVVVIEARDRVGGRVRTLGGADWPVPVELGGQRVATEGASILRDELAAAVEAPQPVESTVRRAEDGEPIGDAGLREAVLDRARAAASEFPFDVPLSTALAALAPLGTESAPGSLSEAEAAQAAIVELIGARTGALARQLSTDHGLDEISPGWNALVLRGLQGYLESLLDGVDVLVTSAVSTVLYDEEGVALRLGAGESISVDRVAVTVPLGVLKDDGITFDPPLPPAHQEAIASLGVGDLETVVLRFDEASWAETADLWLTDPTADTLVSEWINLQSLAGAPVLVGLVPPQRAARYASLSDEALIDQAMLELAPFR